MEGRVGSVTVAFLEKGDLLMLVLMTQQSIYDSWLLKFG